jgi:6-phosphogluconate dehydrogenase
MKLGMVGLGRMGSNMVRRLLRAGHECVAFDVRPEAAEDLAKAGAIAANSLAGLTGRLEPPRARRNSLEMRAGRKTPCRGAR